MRRLLGTITKEKGPYQNTGWHERVSGIRGGRQQVNLSGADSKTKSLHEGIVIFGG